MAKRPRGTCRICGRAWRARWQADTLIVLAHSESARECPGSGLPDATQEAMAPQPRQSEERWLPSALAS